MESNKQTLNALKELVSKVGWMIAQSSI